MKIKCLLIVIFLLCLTACNPVENVNDIEEDNIVINNSEEDLTGELTISAIFWNDSMNHMIDLFCSQHPNVSIDVKAPNTEEILQSDIGTLRGQMITELLSGNGADIYEIQLISSYKYSKSGMFENLYDFMEQDSDFEIQDYYTNILKCCEHNGELNWFPQSFSYSFIQFNENIVGDLDYDFNTVNSINYKDIDSIYNLAKKDEMMDQDMVIDNEAVIKTICNPIEIRSYIDTDTLSSTLDSDDFIEYLIIMNELPFAPFKPDVNGPSSIDFEDSHQLTKIWRLSFFDWEELFNISINETKPYQFSSSDGKNTFAINDLGLAISKSSKNKALAWEFIKFVSSEQKYEFDDENSELFYRKLPGTSFMPINRHNYEQLADHFSEGELWQVEYIDNINRNLDAKSFYDPNIDSIIKDLLQDYFDRNLMSANDCATQIQDVISRYLDE